MILPAAWSSLETIMSGCMSSCSRVPLHLVKPGSTLPRTSRTWRQSCTLRSFSGLDSADDDDPPGALLAEGEGEAVRAAYRWTRLCMMSTRM